MALYSKTLLMQNKINIEEVDWRDVSKTPNSVLYKKIEYNPIYEGYFLHTYDMHVSFSKDLITWNYDYSKGYIYDEISGYYYKVTTKDVNNQCEIYISKMISWKIFDETILIDSFDKNLYGSFNFYGSARLGNEHIFIYSYNTKKENLKVYTSDTYQKIAYTSDFKNWKTKITFSELDADLALHDQQTSLGSSGSKYVIISSRNEGYCPVTFITPEDYVVGAPIWTGGNMTSANGFYCNNTWYYFQFHTEYKSNDGINFSKVSNKWIHPDTIFYNSCYITNNFENGLLRVYDKDFLSFTQISTPCEMVRNILGIIENKLFILGTNSIIYSTNIEKIIA